MKSRTPQSWSSPAAVLVACAALLVPTLAIGPKGRAAADEFTSHRQLLPPPQKLTDQPPLPELSAEEMTYLMRLARQAVEHAAQTGKRLVPTDVPASLRGKDHVVYVTCRQAGHLIESMGGEGHSLAENLCRAAEFVAGSEKFGQDKLAGIRASTVELNVLGPGQALGWQTLEHLSFQVSPGVHGLAFRYANRPPVALKDTVAPTHGYGELELVRKLVEKAGWTETQVIANRDKITFYRFRSIHLLERDNPLGYAQLFRCAQLVRPEQIDRDRVNLLIDLTGRYLLHRQINFVEGRSRPIVRPMNGLFSYSYSPPQEQYLAGDNAVRQAGTTWSLARMAAATRDPIYESAALKAIDAPKLRYLDKDRKAACASYPADVGAEALGATALLVCAICDLPDNRALHTLRDSLADGLLHQQRADGSFKIFYDDRPDDANKYFYPGECLLALGKMHRQTGNAKYLQAVQAAFGYYHEMFQKDPNRAFVPWHIQAWALAYDITGDRKYLDFVFQMADYLTTFQADEKSDVYPDMIGGFVNEQGFAGVASAAFMEGMVEAFRVARKSGDADRTRKYHKVVLLGVRFLDQLTFKDLDAFYCVSRKDVIGGVKMSPADHTIRIDNCMHVVNVLLSTRELLFSAPAAPPPPTDPAPRPPPPAVPPGGGP